MHPFVLLQHSEAVLAWSGIDLAALFKLPLETFHAFRGWVFVENLRLFPQKKKFPINFFEIFPDCSPPSIVSKKKKTIKMIGHHSRLRQMMGQSYPIYACSRANHEHYSSVVVPRMNEALFNLGIDEVD